jgi:hypothetical protein
MGGPATRDRDPDVEKSAHDEYGNDLEYRRRSNCKKANGPRPRGHFSPCRCLVSPKKSPAECGAGVKGARVGLSRPLRSIVYQRCLALASLQLMKSLAVGRAVAHMNPPAAVPQITRADTQSELSVALGASFHCFSFSAPSPIGHLLRSGVQSRSRNMVSSEAKNGFNCVSCGTFRAGGEARPRAIRQNENPAEGFPCGGCPGRGSGTLMAVPPKCCWMTFY